MPPIPTNGRPIALNEARLAAVTSVPLGDVQSAAAQLQALHVGPLEFGPAFSRIAAVDPDNASRFATAFTSSLQTRDELAQLYDQVARAPEPDRLAILSANRSGDAGLRVVHAVSALPEAQGSVIMRDFLMPDG